MIEPEDVRIRASNLDDNTRAILVTGGKARVGMGHLKSLAFATSGVTLNNSQLQKLRNVTAKATGERICTGTTADKLMDFLRTNPEACFVALYHNAGTSYHRQPRGRKRKNQLDIQQIKEHMVVNEETAMSLSAPLPQEMSDDSHTSDDEVLEPVANPGHLENTSYLIESPTSESVEYDPEEYSDVIHDYVKDSRNAVDCDSRHKILLSSAWATKQEIRRFRKYPEIVYVDTTFNTNKELRPFLMICGKDADAHIFVLLRIYLCNECAWQFRWCFSHVLPLVVGKETTGRVRLILTDGDCNEYSQIDSAITRSFPNALRGRCCYHIVDIPQGRKGMTPRSEAFDDPEKGEEHRKVIKHWIYTWMKASGGCETKAEYDLSKKLLFLYLKHDVHARADLGIDSCKSFQELITGHVVPLDDHFVFYRRRFLRHYEGYMNTPIESMNRVIKHANHSVSGSFSMAEAARTIDKHAAASEREKNIQSGRSLNSLPTYTKCTKVLPRLNRVSQHEFNQQYLQSVEYEWIRVAKDRWWVKRRQHSVKLGCKIPRFLRLRKVTLSKEKYLYCDCGFFARCGIPCRHVLCLDPTYELRDFSVRWWKVYDYFAFREGYADLTKQLLELENLTAEGKVSNLPSLPDDTVFPILSEKCGLSYKKWKDIHDHDGPICLNYTRNDTWVDPAKSGNLEVDGFSHFLDSASDEESTLNGGTDQMSVDLTQESCLFAGTDEGETGFSITEEPFVSEVADDQGNKSYFQLRPYFHTLISLADNDDRMTLYCQDEMRKIETSMKRMLYTENPELKVPEGAEFVSVNHVLNRKKNKVPTVAN